MGSDMTLSTSNAPRRGRSHSAQRQCDCESVRGEYKKAACELVSGFRRCLQRPCKHKETLEAIRAKACQIIKDLKGKRMTHDRKYSDLTKTLEKMRDSDNCSGSGRCCECEKSLIDILKLADSRQWGTAKDCWMREVIKTTPNKSLIGYIERPVDF